MPPSKILQGRCIKPGASFHRKKVFLVGFSLAFPRFPQILKKRLNKSLKMKVEKNILRGLFITDVFFKEPDD